MSGLAQRLNLSDTLAQVVLGQSKKDPNVYVAMKVVYLQSPEVLDDPEHLAILRK